MWEPFSLPIAKLFVLVRTHGVNVQCHRPQLYERKHMSNLSTGVIVFLNDDGTVRSHLELQFKVGPKRAEQRKYLEAITRMDAHCADADTESDDAHAVLADIYQVQDYPGRQREMCELLDLIMRHRPE